MKQGFLIMGMGFTFLSLILTILRNEYIAGAIYMVGAVIAAGIYGVIEALEELKK